MKRQRVGMVITAKNERELLRSNILYHRYLGIEQFFIYDDGADDGTPDTVNDLPYVRLASSVDPGCFGDRPDLRDFVLKAAEHHTARQNLNVCSAMEDARQLGLDWLIALDADELVSVDLATSCEDHLIEFFARTDSDVQVVRFITLEAVQRGLDYGNVFAEETLFRRLEAPIRRKIYDPFKQRKWSVSSFYGQGLGKSAIRLSVDAKPRTTHKFVALDGSKLREIRLGYLLHYQCFNFSDFIKKFRNFKCHPDTYATGNLVEYVPKRLWRDLVNSPGFSEEYLRSYYDRWVRFGEKEVRKLMRRSLLRQTPAIFEVMCAKHAFAEIARSR